MTEPCHRHSRADSALHGDECAECLRADLAAARADVARLREALEKVLVWLPESGTVHEALAATTAPPVVPRCKSELTVVAKPCDWPEDFGDENGNYMNECILCHQEFIGHKRRTICKLCAHSVVPLADAEALAAALEKVLKLVCSGVMQCDEHDALAAYRAKHHKP